LKPDGWPGVTMRARHLFFICLLASGALAIGPAFADTAPVAAEAGVQAGDGSAMLAALPRDLSPWNMFLTADAVVKAVLIGLGLASVLTWTVWLAKSIELAAARRRVRASLSTLSKVTSLRDALSRLADMEGVAREFLRAADIEMRMSAEVSASGKDGIKERTISRLERIEAAAGRGMSSGTGILATIGATAPFIGLFGTVWGIMNSFIGIAQSQTTNLAVVAPGIAEALLATAVGLVAAIPAVVFYNGFARSIAGYRALAGDVAAEVMRLVSRDLDRHASAPLLRDAAE